MSDAAAAPPIEIEVPAAAGPESAEALAAELRAALPGRPLHIDASRVETISGPYVLTLVSALETNVELSPPAVVRGATAAFVDGFTDLGFFQEMMRMEFAT